jgi:hypothetical protein
MVPHAARETLLGTALSLGKRLVTLAGDTHNAWHSNLTLKFGIPGLVPARTKVGEEFATSSVSSPGLEDYLSAIPSVQLNHCLGCHGGACCFFRGELLASYYSLQSSLKNK